MNHLTKQAKFCIQRKMLKLLQNEPLYLTRVRSMRKAKVDPVMRDWLLVIPITSFKCRSYIEFNKMMTTEGNHPCIFSDLHA
jgi:hypothetical protein